MRLEGAQARKGTYTDGKSNDVMCTADAQIYFRVWGMYVRVLLVLTKVVRPPSSSAAPTFWVSDCRYRRVDVRLEHYWEAFWLYSATRTSKPSFYVSLQCGLGYVVVGILVVLRAPRKSLSFVSVATWNQDFVDWFCCG